eukprot:360224-Chlamydomonas_euryale.AAC.4
MGRATSAGQSMAVGPARPRAWRSMTAEQRPLQKNGENVDRILGQHAADTATCMAEAAWANGDAPRRVQRCKTTWTMAAWAKGDVPFQARRPGRCGMAVGNVPWRTVTRGTVTTSVAKTMEASAAHGKAHATGRHPQSRGVAASWRHAGLLAPSPTDACTPWSLHMQRARVLWMKSFPDAASAQEED